MCIINANNYQLDLINSLIMEIYIDKDRMLEKDKKSNRLIVKIIRWIKMLRNIRKVLNSIKWIRMFNVRQNVNCSSSNYYNMSNTNNNNNIINNNNNMVY